MTWRASRFARNMEIGRRSIDLLGNRYGRLLVVDFAGTSKHRAALWRCICDCGNETIVPSNSLRTGHVRSCGCLHRESALRRAEEHKLHEGRSAFNMLYDVYRRSAKRRNLFFGLTKEDISFLTQMNCFYCNRPPEQVKRSTTRHGDYIYNGIDRVNNELGYTMDNVVPCCKHCNYMKNNTSVTEFKQRVLDIVKHRDW